MRGRNPNPKQNKTITRIRQKLAGYATTALAYVNELRERYSYPVLSLVEYESELAKERPEADHEVPCLRARVTSESVGACACMSY